MPATALTAPRPSQLAQLALYGVAICSAIGKLVLLFACAFVVPPLIFYATSWFVTDIKDAGITGPDVLSALSTMNLHGWILCWLGVLGTLSLIMLSARAFWLLLQIFCGGGFLQILMPSLPAYAEFATPAPAASNHASAQR